MLIILIIEFELRGPGPPSCTCTLTTVYFYNKINISKENLWMYYYFLLKILHEAKYLAFSTLAKSLIIKFNPEMQDFKRVLNLNCEWKLNN